MGTEEQFSQALIYVTQKAKDKNDKLLLDWLKNKESNPWILRCLSPATSKMSRTDWFTTSHNTNIAESAHAISQREGKNLSLVAAIEKAQQLDKRVLDTAIAVQEMGIQHKYGNNSTSGRIFKNLNHSTNVRKQKEAQKPEVLMLKEVIDQAQEMIRDGIDKSVIENLLKAQGDVVIARKQNTEK